MSIKTENVVKTVVKRFISAFFLMFFNSKEILSSETQKTKKNMKTTFRLKL